MLPKTPGSSCWWNGLDHWRSFLCLADLVADGDHRLVMVGLGCLESGIDSWSVRRWFCGSFYGHFGQWFSEHVDDYSSHNVGHNFKDDCSVNVDVRVFFERSSVTFFVAFQWRWGPMGPLWDPTGHWMWLALQVDMKKRIRMYKAKGHCDSQMLDAEW